MNRLFGKLPAITAAILVAASFAMVSDVDAAGGGAAVAVAAAAVAVVGGGGGGGGGGGARAGGGGAQAGARWRATKRAGEQLPRRCAHERRPRHQRQQREQRQRRAQRQRQWQQQLLQQRLGQRLPSGGHGGCDHGNGGRHRLDRARPPPGCVPVNYGGVVYQQCGSTWYAPQGSQFAVVAPPY